MRFDRSVVRVYGWFMLGIVVPTMAVAAVIFGSFSHVPRIRYLVPILGLWVGLLVVSWLAMALYYLVQARSSRAA